MSNSVRLRFECDLFVRFSDCIWAYSITERALCFVYSFVGPMNCFGALCVFSRSMHVVKGHFECARVFFMLQLMLIDSTSYMNQHISIYTCRLALKHDSGHRFLATNCNPGGVMRQAASISTSFSQAR